MIDKLHVSLLIFVVSNFSPGYSWSFLPSKFRWSPPARDVISAKVWPVQKGSYSGSSWGDEAHIGAVSMESVWKVGRWPGVSPGNSSSESSLIQIPGAIPHCIYGTRNLLLLAWMQRPIHPDYWPARQGDGLLVSEMYEEELLAINTLKKSNHKNNTLNS